MAGTLGTVQHMTIQIPASNRRERATRMSSLPFCSSPCTAVARFSCFYRQSCVRIWLMMWDAQGANRFRPSMIFFLAEFQPVVSRMPPVMLLSIPSPSRRIVDRAVPCSCSPPLENKSLRKGFSESCPRQRGRGKVSRFE